MTATHGSMIVALDEALKLSSSSEKWQRLREVAGSADLARLPTVLAHHFFKQSGDPTHVATILATMAVLEDGGVTPLLDPVIHVFGEICSSGSEVARQAAERALRLVCQSVSDERQAQIFLKFLPERFPFDLRKLSTIASTIVVCDNSSPAYVILWRQIVQLLVPPPEIANLSEDVQFDSSLAERLKVDIHSFRNGVQILLGILAKLRATTAHIPAEISAETALVLCLFRDSRFSWSSAQIVNASATVLSDIERTRKHRLEHVLLTLNAKINSSLDTYTIWAHAYLALLTMASTLLPEESCSIALTLCLRFIQCSDVPTSLTVRSLEKVIAASLPTVLNRHSDTLLKIVKAALVFQDDASFSTLVRAVSSWITTLEIQSIEPVTDNIMQDVLFHFHLCSPNKPIVKLYFDLFTTIVNILKLPFVKFFKRLLPHIVDSLQFYDDIALSASVRFFEALITFCWPRIKPWAHRLTTAIQSLDCFLEKAQLQSLTLKLVLLAQ